MGVVFYLSVWGKSYLVFISQGEEVENCICLSGLSCTEPGGGRFTCRGNAHQPRRVLLPHVSSAVKRSLAHGARWQLFSSCANGRSGSQCHGRTLGRNDLSDSRKNCTEFYSVLLTPLTLFNPFSCIFVSFPFSFSSWHMITLWHLPPPASHTLTFDLARAYSGKEINIRSLSKMQLVYLRKCSVELNWHRL